MRERGIPFSAPMVRALLAGTKTQTRRVVKWRDLTPGLNMSFTGLGVHSYVPGLFTLEGRSRNSWESRSSPTRCPYGQPGDRLWVREAWRSGKLTDRFPPREMTPHPVWYEADGPAPEATNGKLRPGMFMPRWASRITLEITKVRVERLQDISVEDCRAEGGAYTSPVDVRSWYRDLWQQINGNGSWEANPWVWCVSFRRVHG